MGGRRKEPVDLILLKGKSNHLTKEEIEKRRAAELKAPSNNIKYPKYLAKDLRRDFTYYAKTLDSIGIFSDLDVDTLARYLIQRKEYLKTVAMMNDMQPLLIYTEMIFDPFGDPTGKYQTKYAENDVYDTLRIQQNTFYTQCRQAASDLGLTVSSRLKLVVPKAPDKEEVSEFDKRYGGI